MGAFVLATALSLRSLRLALPPLSAWKVAVDPTPQDGTNTVPFRFWHYPYLGTTLEVRVGGLSEGDGGILDAAVMAEVDRLERLFSVFDPDSELRRWTHREIDQPGPELQEVLAGALRWQRWSAGAFNPMVGLITARWQQAEDEQVEPRPGELAALASSIREPRYVVDSGGTIGVVGDLHGLSLNAYAKGWIVDRAVQRGLEAGPPCGGHDLVVNAGGDLRHVGPRALAVGIENPHRAYDNAPPLSSVIIGQAATATSGSARRAFHVGIQRYSQIIDPRTGTTVQTPASVSVVAPDAATADVLATILAVAHPGLVLERATKLGVAWLIVDQAGSRRANQAWTDLELAADTVMLNAG